MSPILNKIAALERAIDRLKAGLAEKEAELKQEKCAHEWEDKTKPIYSKTGPALPDFDDGIPFSSQW
jgi:hypothetical protein